MHRIDAVFLDVMVKTDKTVRTDNYLWPMRPPGAIVIVSDTASDKEVDIMANARKLTSEETWVLVADARRAEFYRRDEPGGPLELVQQLTDDEARARERDLVADKPGRSFDSAGQGRHAMDPAHSEKQRLRSAFAQRITHMLDAARMADRYTQLIIVAAPAMLGELRAHLNAPTASRVAAEFSKELAGQGPEAIAKLID